MERATNVKGSEENAGRREWGEQVAMRAKRGECGKKQEQSRAERERMRNKPKDSEDTV